MAYHTLCMHIEFGDDDLDRLEVDEAFTGGRSQPLVRAYRSKVNIIRQAQDERDFRGLKSLHFEKMEGKRKHQHSMRLNDQYRLVIELVEGNPGGKVVRIMAIEDYH
jgi:proteic killer suppression protein